MVLCNFCAWGKLPDGKRCSLVSIVKLTSKKLMKQILKQTKNKQRKTTILHLSPNAYFFLFSMKIIVHFFSKPHLGVFDLRNSEVLNR